MPALAGELIRIGEPGYGYNPDADDLAEAHNFEVLSKMVDDVYAERRSATTVARLAVAAGFLLIGCTESQEVHYPVGRNQHLYHDQRDERHKHHLPRGKKFLRAGANIDEAIACALWGDYNSRAERIERCRPYVGDLTSDLFGWGQDTSKTVSGRNTLRAVPYLRGVPFEEDAIIYTTDPRGSVRRWYLMYADTRERPGNIRLLGDEESLVKIHARPELISAASHPTHPLTGVIDLVPRRYFPRNVRHELGQWVTEQAVATTLSIPIRGNLDLPFDRIGTRYQNIYDKDNRPA